MKQRNIKVSVIMACHNSSAYMDEAVNSVLNQTLSDLELILIDDGSTDSTLEIAKRQQILDERVSVLSLPVKSGPAVARNAGIGLAKGGWIGILDSDDIATPSRFEEQLKLAESDKRLVMAGSSAISIDSKGNAIKQHRYPTNHDDLVKRLIFMRAFPPHSSMIYKKDVAVKLKGFNTKYIHAEDYEFCLRLSERGRITSIGKPLVKIRIHAQNRTNEEEGTLVKIFGFAASVCYFIRLNGYTDPSDGQDESFWKEFIEWVAMRIAEEGVYKKQNAWTEARTAFFEDKNRLTGAFRFGATLFQSGSGGMLIWEKFFGSSLPLRFAREWMKRSCAAS